MEAISKEVLINTETVISCKATGIYEQLSIKWTGFTAGENFVESSGSYDSSTNSQTGTLTIRSAAVNTDKTFTCSISSVINEDSALESVDVHLNVYGKKEIKCLFFAFRISGYDHFEKNHLCRCLFEQFWLERT